MFNKLDGVRDALSFLTSLSGEDRERLMKAGAAGAGAIPIAHRIATTFPTVLPDTFDKATMDKEVLLITPLQALREELASVLSGVDDTLLKLRSECMKHATEVYRHARDAEGSVPEVKPLVDELASHLQRTPGL